MVVGWWTNGSEIPNRSVWKTKHWCWLQHAWMGARCLEPSREKKKTGLENSQHLKDEDKKKRNLQRRQWRCLCEITGLTEGFSSGSKWPLVSHTTKKSRKIRTATCPLASAIRNVCVLSENSFRKVRKTDSYELEKREQEASGDKLSRTLAASKKREDSRQMGACVCARACV